MIGIIKKEILTFLGYSLIMTGGIGFYLIITGRHLNLGIIGLASLYTFLSVIGAIATSEQKEYNSNGYLFLKNLPLTINEIVAGKFIINLINIFFAFSLILICTLMIKSNIHITNILFITLIYCLFSVCTISAIGYFLIFKFGINNVLKYIWIFFGVSVIFGLLFIEFVIHRKIINLHQTFSILSNLNLKFSIILFIVTMFFYYQMYLFSVKAFKKRENQ